MKFLILLLISNFSWSAVTVGSNIKAKDFNSAKYNLGDIKQSVLTEAQFQQVNGSCWVLLASKNIAGSDLATFTNGRISSLPNAAGLFLRDAGGNAAPLGQTQSDSFVAHKHLQNDFNYHVYSYTNENGQVTRGSGVLSDVSGGNYSSQSPFTKSYGGNETRPANTALNYFVKINKVCNFN